MPESFGARLRQQRERQQITLTSIAEQTKINVALLEALERDDVSHWPAGVLIVVPRPMGPEPHFTSPATGAEVVSAQPSLAKLLSSQSDRHGRSRSILRRGPATSRRRTLTV